MCQWISESTLGGQCQWILNSGRRAREPVSPEAGGTKLEAGVNAGAPASNSAKIRRDGGWGGELESSVPRRRDPAGAESLRSLPRRPDIRVMRRLSRDDRGSESDGISGGDSEGSTLLAAQEIQSMTTMEFF